VPYGVASAVRVIDAASSGAVDHSILRAIHRGNAVLRVGAARVCLQLRHVERIDRSRPVPVAHHDHARVVRVVRPFGVAETAGHLIGLGRGDVVRGERGTGYATDVGNGGLQSRLFLLRDHHVGVRELLDECGGDAVVDCRVHGMAPKRFDVFLSPSRVSVTGPVIRHHVGERDASGLSGVRTPLRAE
jgi:hypothetical protein